jgi:protein phosphatase 2C family protein 2/3
LAASEAPSPEERSNRIIRGTDLIANKLKKQFECGVRQTNGERDKGFEYLVAPEDFAEDTQRKEIGGYEVGVCCYIGRRREMEDAYVTAFFDFAVRGKVYPIQLFGILDGHGGTDASFYVMDNLERKLHEMLTTFCANGLTDEAIWNALKMTFVELNKGLGECESGTTATVAIILDGKLWTANVGDSKTILDSGIQLSEDAKLTDPRYQKGIVKRGGFVFEGRINGVLAVARALGDCDVRGVNARPKITSYSLSAIPRGSHLILACDGIYDVSSTRQVAAAVRGHGEQSATELAKNIVYSAFRAGSRDNLSALVVNF